MKYRLAIAGIKEAFSEDVVCDGIIFDDIWARFYRFAQPPEHPLVRPTVLVAAVARDHLLFIEKLEEP